MRILSIDYGKKRTGLAVTDPLQIIANGWPQFLHMNFSLISKLIFRKNRWSALLSENRCNLTGSQVKTWQE